MNSKANTSMNQRNHNNYRLKRPSTQVLGLLVTLVGISAWSTQVSNAANSVVLPASTTEQLAPSVPQSSSKLTDSHLGITAQTKQNSSTPAAITNQRVKVFFPPNRSQNFTDVRAVWRTTSSRSIAQFAIEQLIAGPTSSERQQGLIPALRLTGNSNCGKDFTISIQGGVARLQFCRQMVSAGVGDDARAKSAITATLKQFTSVSNVVILDRSGNCLGDQSGENRCLPRR